MAEPTRQARYDVFIAHAGDAKEFAGRLATRLKHAGLRAFFDEREMEASQAFDSAIERAVRTCRAFLFVVSAGSVSPGSYARTELHWASSSRRRLFWIHAPGHEGLEPPSALDGLVAISVEGDRIAQAVSVLGRALTARGRTFLLVMPLAMGAGLAWWFLRAPPLPPPAPAFADPRPDMVRIEGHHLRLGVQNPQTFRGWCLDQGEQATTCDDFLAKASHTETDVRTFDLDRNEVASQDFAAWIQGELTAKRVELGSEHLLRVSDKAMLWEPACGGLGAYEAQGGRIRTRSLEDKVDVAQAVACVSVEGAEAYCQSRGKRLPTEAEWELAAGGPAKRWLPWDPSGKLKPKCEDAVFARGDDGRCKHLLNRPQAANDGDGDVTPDGVRALGGNVSEWARIDAAGDSGAAFVACGGNWDGPAVSMHPAKRLRVASSVEYVIVGFRCAMTPQPKTEIH